VEIEMISELAFILGVVLGFIIGVIFAAWLKLELTIIRDKA